MRNRSIVRRAAWSGLLAASLVLSNAGCSGANKGELANGGWEEIVAAAKDEGSVIFYNGSTVQQGNRLIEAFNRKYPDIAVRAERGGAEMVARVEAQISSGADGADVYLLGDTEWFREKTDAFLPLDGGPGIEGLDEKAWAVKGKAPVASTSPYSMFVWNTEIFPDGFADYGDFLDEAARGRLAMRGDASKSAAGFLDFLDRSVGKDYLRQIGALEPKLYPSVVPATEAVASGEVGATIAALPPQVFGMIAAGAPIDYTYPNPGYAFEYGVGALQNAHRPNAAVVFTDFMMSPEGQAALNGDQYGIASRPDVPGAVNPQGWQRLDSAAFTPEVLNDWNAKIDEYLQ
ncbi:MAG: extracellular solute-binding protein [Hyphomicrobiales bacterium]|nr:MAG: extracellular solute-binding protein [Hyphomicrobiales bacterium]